MTCISTNQSSGDGKVCDFQWSKACIREQHAFPNSTTVDIDGRTYTVVSSLKTQLPTLTRERGIELASLSLAEQTENERLDREALEEYERKRQSDLERMRKFGSDTYVDSDYDPDERTGHMGAALSPIDLMLQQQQEESAADLLKADMGKEKAG